MWRSFLLTLFVVGAVGTLVLAWNSSRDSAPEQPRNQQHQTTASSTANRPADSKSGCVNCNFVSP